MAQIGKDIFYAKRLLEDGQLVAIPTETVYGLAANALDAEAVTRIFIAKNRPTFDPLIVHVADRLQAGAHTGAMPAAAAKLAEAFWPGPLTLVLPRSRHIPELVTSGLDTVGIRCPNHPLTLELLRSLAFPLAAPSANPFGYVSPTRPEHVNAQLGDRVRYILDGGPCQVGIESTIVGFEGDDAVIYRRGGLSQEAIEQIVGPVKTHLHSSSNPLTPGQLESHYAPHKPVKLGHIDDLLARANSDRVAILSFSKDYKRPHQFVLSPSGSLEEAAQNLFFAMRQLDNSPVDYILAEEVPNEGLGMAINDRLRRASTR